LDKYTVKLMPRNLIDELEKAILTLDFMPYRGAERKVGAYANKGYRQVFVKTL